MATVNVTLFVNVSRQILQASTTNGTAVDAPAFTVGDTLDVRLCFVEQIGRGPSAEYSVLTPSSLGCKLGIGIDGTANVLTTSWTASGNYLVGVVDCNVAGFSTAVDAGTTQYLEIEIAELSGFKTVYKQRVTCRKGVITSGATVPLPADEYYTKAEMESLFLKKSNPAGVTATFTSPDGASQRIIGCNDNKTAQDDTV